MHSPLSRRLQLAAVVALSPLCQGLAAQSPAAWTILDVPGGVQPGALQQIGKIITYTELNQVWAYSAFAHAWVATPITGSVSVRAANDLALVVDGSTYSAFASYTGRWESISLSASATVLNPTSQRNDSIWLVLDGGNLWAFTAFRGTWIQLGVGPTAAVQTERHVAIVVDGTTVHALSALHDAWVTTTAPAAPSAFRARGTAAVAASSAGLIGFSALANRWSAWPAPGTNPQITVNDDVQMISSGNVHVGFSGLRGGFAQSRRMTPSTRRIFSNTVSVETFANRSRNARCNVTCTTPSGFFIGSSAGAYSIMPKSRTPVFSARISVWPG